MENKIQSVTFKENQNFPRVMNHFKEDKNPHGTSSIKEDKNHIIYMDEK